MSISWMKKGADSVAVQKKDEQEYEARKAEQGKMWRFWLKDKAEAQITFVDGDLSKEGFLLPPRFYEHSLMINGQLVNIVCPEKTQPDGGEEMKCPLCEGGDRSSLVAVFTIIDHRTVPSKDGQKMYKDVKRLLVVKGNTFEQLNKIAIKRGGLACARFDVARVGEKAPAVGSMFDFCEKKPLAELQAMYMDEIVDPKTNKKVTTTRFVAADYENEIVFRSGAELRKLGYGKPAIGMSGFETPPTQATQPAPANYEQNL